MAHNPLLGSRISLISKKNIRYEGTLYAINEADATVALENVRSYGTEGRELLDTTGTASHFIPPQDVVHTYLLFRGQDIKDLHVHEKSPAEQPAKERMDSVAPVDPGATPTKNEVSPAESVSTSVEKRDTLAEAPIVKETQPTVDGKEEVVSSEKLDTSDNARNKQGSKKNHASRRTNQNMVMVGSGASLLNRNLRGARGETAKVAPEDAQGEFDFESNLAGFEKATIDTDRTGDDTKENEDESNVYSKNDFFDTISCDALDRQAGIDNRLRGAAERSLNLDTFGAVSLETGRRSGWGRGRGRGRGFGRGRGQGRGNRGGGTVERQRNHDRKNYNQASGPSPRQNNRWKESAH